MSECPQLWKNAVVMCVVFSSLNGFVCAGEDSETGPVVQRVGKVVIEKDVAYGRSGERVLMLDVIRPAETRDETPPVIVFIHGGACVLDSESVDAQIAVTRGCEVMYDLSYAPRSLVRVVVAALQAMV